MAPTSNGSLLDFDIGAAIAITNLGGLPADVVSSLLVDAARTAISAGTTIHREDEATPHFEILVRGLVRVHVTALDGRTLTIRYCRPGALIGVATIYSTASSRPFAVQALVDSEMLRLKPGVVRSIADREPQLTTALLIETSERALGFVAELSDTVSRPSDGEWRGTSSTSRQSSRREPSSSRESASRNSPTPPAQCVRSSYQCFANCARLAWCEPNAAGSLSASPSSC